MADRREEEEVVLKIRSFCTKFPKDIVVIKEKRDTVSHKKGCILYEWEIYYKIVN
jgi:hypothetical protein